MLKDSQSEISLVSDKENLPREAKKTNDSTLDRIYKHLHSSSRVELDAEETKILERWEKAWLLLCRHRTRNAVAKLVVRLFNVSRATAYDDIRCAMNIFSDPRENMKEAKRAIAEDAFLKGADKAWKNGDLEMHKKYMDSYSKINKLEEEDADGGLAELLKSLKPSAIIIQIKKNDIESEAERLRNEITTDIDFDVEQ